MKTATRFHICLAILATALLRLPIACAGDSPALPAASIDGSGAGWVALGEADFSNVNCHSNTWTWKDGTAICTGEPTGVIASQRPYTNYELVVEWCHRREAGNSGIFVWTTPESLDRLRAGKGSLPDGIEVQVLDLGYKTNYERGGRRKANWFTCHGDVFPVRAEMTPFPPVAPNGKRSFPSEERSRGINEWNHYYIRCINGEVRLWVNGAEVSGGTDCQPSTGYICLESEGSPVEFRNLRIRELP